MSTIFGFDSLYTEHGASYNAIATVARVSLHENVCILWTPEGETVKGHSVKEILTLKNNFELDNNHNLIIYS